MTTPKQTDYDTPKPTRRVKQARDNGAVSISPEKLKKSAEVGENIMPAIIEAVANYATVEEICVALRDVYGVYEEPAF